MAVIVVMLTQLGGLAATPADASIVQRTPPPEGAPSPTLTVRGAPGESNWLVLRIGDGTLTVEDRAAPLTAGEGCEALDAHKARCPSATAEKAQKDFILVDGGDGDDVIDTTRFPASFSGNAFPPTPARLLGGPGDDVLVGVMLDGADGGPGEDVVEAQGGASGAEVSGGTDDDYIRVEQEYVVVEGDDDGGDVIVAPVVSFAARRKPIRASAPRRHQRRGLPDTGGRADRLWWRRRRRVAWRRWA